MSGAGSDPRFVYLVFSHRNPGQLERLVNRILVLSPRSQVILHHDGRFDPMVWTRPPGARVHMVPDPQSVEWGGFSQVLAGARALRYLEEGLRYDFCAMISGQDYPVRNLAAWELDVADAGHDFVLNARQVVLGPGVSRRVLADDPLFGRYGYRWVRVPGIPRYVVAGANRAARAVGAGPVIETRPFTRRLGFPRRSIFHDGWKCYKGSQWMALSRGAVRRILDVMESRPDLTRYYSRTLIPDESFFQTILCNQPDLTARPESLTFVSWEGPRSRHPSVITARNIHGALSSGSAFARKFDIDVDKDAFDVADRASDGREVTAL